MNKNILKILSSVETPSLKALISGKQQDVKKDVLKKPEPKIQDGGKSQKKIIKKSSVNQSIEPKKINKKQSVNVKTNVSKPKSSVAKPSVSKPSVTKPKTIIPEKKKTTINKK